MRSRWRSADRRRSTTHSACWAEAERRTAAGGFLASRGRPALPVGEESCPPPLRQRRSRRSRPPVRSGHERSYGTHPTGQARRRTGGLDPASTRATRARSHKDPPRRTRGGKWDERDKAPTCLFPCGSDGCGLEEIGEGHACQRRRPAPGPSNDAARPRVCGRLHPDAVPAAPAADRVRRASLPGAGRLDLRYARKEGAEAPSVSRASPNRPPRPGRASAPGADGPQGPHGLQGA